MAGTSQSVIFQGLSKAELAELQGIFGIEPDIINVATKDGQLSVITHPPERTLGEPLTWAAIWLFAKNTKIGARATVLLDKILRSRQVIVVKKSVTIRRPNGDIETIDASIEAKGDAAEGLLKKLGRDAFAFDAKDTASPATIEHVPDATTSKTPRLAKPRSSLGPTAEAKRIPADKTLAKPAKAAATQPKTAEPKKGKKSDAKAKGK